MRTLIVEDNLRDLKLMHSLLQMEGHEVIDAVSAEEAISLLEKDIPEIILIDLRLPRMDGISLGRELHQMAATADIPMIAVTACAEDFSKNQARAAGFAAYFVKPINTRTICQEVAAVLKSHRGF